MMRRTQTRGRDCLSGSSSIVGMTNQTASLVLLLLFHLQSLACCWLRPRSPPLSPSEYTAHPSRRRLLLRFAFSIIRSPEAQPQRPLSDVLADRDRVVRCIKGIESEVVAWPWVEAQGLLLGDFSMTRLGRSRSWKPIYTAVCSDKPCSGFSSRRYRLESARIRDCICHVTLRKMVGFNQLHAYTADSEVGDFGTEIQSPAQQQV